MLRGVVEAASLDVFKRPWGCVFGVIVVVLVGLDQVSFSLVPVKVAQGEISCI